MASFLISLSYIEKEGKENFEGKEQPVWLFNILLPIKIISLSSLFSHCGSLFSTEEGRKRKPHLWTSCGSLCCSHLLHITSLCVGSLWRVCWHMLVCLYSPPYFLILLSPFPIAWDKKKKRKTTTVVVVVVCTVLLAFPSPNLCCSYLGPKGLGLCLYILPCLPPPPNQHLAAWQHVTFMLHSYSVQQRSLYGYSTACLYIHIMPPTTIQTWSANTKRKYIAQKEKPNNHFSWFLGGRATVAQWSHAADMRDRQMTFCFEERKKKMITGGGFFSAVLSRLLAWFDVALPPPLLCRLARVSLKRCQKRKRSRALLGRGNALSDEKGTKTISLKSLVSHIRIISCLFFILDILGPGSLPSPPP